MRRSSTFLKLSALLVVALVTLGMSNSSRLRAIPAAQTTPQPTVQPTAQPTVHATIQAAPQSTAVRGTVRPGALIAGLRLDTNIEDAFTLNRFCEEADPATIAATPQAQDLIVQPLMCDVPGDDPLFIGLALQGTSAQLERVWDNFEFLSLSLNGEFIDLERIPVVTEDITVDGRRLRVRRFNVALRDLKPGKYELRWVYRLKEAISTEEPAGRYELRYTINIGRANYAQPCPAILASPATAAAATQAATRSSEPGYVGLQFNMVSCGGQVEGVITGGPAARSGIFVGDIITAINGRPVTGTAQFRAIAATLRVGETVTFTISRDGRTRNVTITLGPRPAEFNTPTPTLISRAATAKATATARATTAATATQSR